MDRRPTVILVIVFVVVLGAGIFLTKTPAGTKLMTTETPTPTVLPKLLSGWPVDQATKIDVHSSENGEFLLQKGADGNWAIDGLNQPIDGGKVSELISSLSSLDTIDTMPASTTLDTVGLQSPTYALSLTGSNGDNEDLLIGNVTPTGSAYYVRLGQGDIVLVRKSSLDEAINLLSVEQLAVKPTQTAVPTGATPTTAP